MNYLELVFTFTKDLFERERCAFLFFHVPLSIVAGNFFFNFESSEIAYNFPTICRKNSEANPSMAAEISRLRGLVREKEEKLHVSRRRYEQLLRKVESSLFHLEKQHRQTKKKLEENIIGNY